MNGIELMKTFVHITSIGVNCCKKKNKEVQNCFVNSVTNQVTDADVLVCILRVHRFAILLSLLKFYFLKPNMYKSFLIISQ